MSEKYLRKSSYLWEWTYPSPWQQSVHRKLISCHEKQDRLAIQISTMASQTILPIAWKINSEEVLVMSPASVVPFLPVQGGEIFKRWERPCDYITWKKWQLVLLAVRRLHYIQVLSSVFGTFWVPTSLSFGTRTSSAFDWNTCDMSSNTLGTLKFVHHNLSSQDAQHSVCKQQ